MKNYNFKEQEEIWNEQNKFPFQKIEEENEEEENDKKLNELDEGEEWCEVCGCNKGIMDDECPTCGC